MLEHLHELYHFYGDLTGMRVARKHISWYTKGLVGSAHFRHHMNRIQSIEEQLAAIDEFFDHLQLYGERLQYTDDAITNPEEMLAVQ